MGLVELTEFLVKSLVVDKDNVSVKEFESDEENTVLIQENIFNKNNWKKVEEPVVE